MAVGAAAVPVASVADLRRSGPGPRRIVGSVHLGPAGEALLTDPGDGSSEDDGDRRYVMLQCRVAGEVPHGLVMASGAFEPSSLGPDLSACAGVLRCHFVAPCPDLDIPLWLAARRLLRNA